MIFLLPIFFTWYFFVWSLQRRLYHLHRQSLVPAGQSAVDRQLDHLGVELVGHFVLGHCQDLLEVHQGGMEQLNLADISHLDVQFGVELPLEF